MARYDGIATYIMAGGRNRALYIGVTSDIWTRVAQHKQGVFPGFSKEKGCTRLVWYEPHVSIEAAIRRERLMKHWLRAWKLALIEENNPDWRDLSDDWYGEMQSAFPTSFSSSSGGA